MRESCGATVATRHSILCGQRAKSPAQATTFGEFSPTGAASNPHGVACRGTGEFPGVLTGVLKGVFTGVFLSESIWPRDDRHPARRSSISFTLWSMSPITASPRVDNGEAALADAGVIGAPGVPGVWSPERERPGTPGRGVNLALVIVNSELRSGAQNNEKLRKGPRP